MGLTVLQLLLCGAARMRVQPSLLELYVNCGWASAADKSISERNVEFDLQASGTVKLQLQYLCSIFAFALL